MCPVINPAAQLLCELKSRNGTQKIAVENTPTEVFCVKLLLRDATNNVPRSVEYVLL